MELLKRNKIRYKELPRYPEVRRDLALLLDENVTLPNFANALSRQKGSAPPGNSL